MTLGGHVVAHNALKYDYCLKECIESMLGICDRVLAVECDSDDGTGEFLDEWCKREPKLRTVKHPWHPVPNTGFKWLIDIVRNTRQMLNTDWYVQLDADEVLHQDEYKWLSLHMATQQRCALVHRYTFWKDAFHELPDGVICNHENVRLGPINCVMSGDLIAPAGAVRGGFKVYHYGHLRRSGAWIEKSKSIHNEALGFVPDHWQKSTPETISDIHNLVPPEQLIPFTGTHPAVMSNWLAERGLI